MADNGTRWATIDWLDLVVERNVGECDFHNLGCKPSPRAALIMIFVNIYTSIDLLKMPSGGVRVGVNKR